MTTHLSQNYTLHKYADTNAWPASVHTLAETNLNTQAGNKVTLK